MRTVLSIVGTRPEAIKMAPVIRELERHPESIRSVVCSTGQHREMLDQALGMFQIVPDRDLHLMTHNQGLAELTARLFSAIDGVLVDVRPSCVLAQGDTTSVFVAAVAAFYRGIPFGHVEAGLRTGDKRSPFPEEINRRLADAVGDLFFTPTERGRQMLLREGVSDHDIYVSGNTVVDALLDIAGRDYDWAGGPLAGVPSDKQLVLITAHRRENFGEPFRELCGAIRDLAYSFERDGVHFVYPVHLNPNVRAPVGEILANIPNVSLIEPVDYLSLVQLMKRSTLILTDSGGIQEEAPTFGVPVLVLRDTTERPEGVEAGVARLVGTGHGSIVTEASRLLSDPAERVKMAARANPYGDGKAAERIVTALLERVS